MSFFDSISPPTLDETSTPLIRRALHRARVVGNFAFVQGVVQLIGFCSGILLVRWLDQREYAYFTIANTMQGTINLLADIGVSVGLVSIGGRVWQDRRRFGELINTGLNLRKRLGVIAILAVIPILASMFLKNGASISYTALLIAIVLAGITVELSIGVLAVVPRLRSDISLIQRIDLTGAIFRLCLLFALAFIFLSAGVAIAVASVTLLLQYTLLRRYVGSVVDLAAPQNAQDRREIIRLTKHLAPNAVFYCLQGQITIFLISFFAHRVSAVAEVGALGRLAMVFTVLSNLLANVFVPAFARCHERGKLRWLFAAIVGGVFAFSLIVLLAAQFFPNEFLFILGNKYAHLHRELLLMVGGAVIGALTGTFWALNASKAWVSGAWLYIPLTLATQAALIPFTDFSSVSGVLTFNLLSSPQSFTQRGVELSGFSLASIGQCLAMPNYGYHLARFKGNMLRRLYRALLPFIVRRPVDSSRSIPLDVFSYSGETALPEQVASLRSFYRHVGRPNSFTIVSDGSFSDRSVRLLEQIDPTISVQLSILPPPEQLPEKFREYLSSHPTGKQLALIMSLPISGPALYIDSDVLFFPAAVDLASRLSLKDAPAYYLADCQFSGDGRLLRNPNEQKDPVNTGVVLLFEKLDWSLGIDRFFVLEGAPNFFTNQTITHLAMHANGARPLDPVKYVLQLDDQFVYADRYGGAALALRHYVNPVRHKFWTSLFS